MDVKHEAPSSASGLSPLPICFPKGTLRPEEAALPGSTIGTWSKKARGAPHHSTSHRAMGHIVFDPHQRRDASEARLSWRDRDFGVDVWGQE